MDPRNLDVRVEGDEDEGYQLHVNMFYMPEEGVIRQTRGYLESDEGPWETEEEAEAAREELEAWWASL